MEAPSEPLELAAAAPAEIVESQESIPAIEQIPQAAQPEMLGDRLTPPISFEPQGVAEIEAPAEASRIGHRANGDC